MSVRYVKSLIMCSVIHIRTKQVSLHVFVLSYMDRVNNADYPRSLVNQIDVHCLSSESPSQYEYYENATMTK
jgi:hypothetical protein